MNKKFHYFLTILILGLAIFRYKVFLLLNTKICASVVGAKCRSEIASNLFLTKISLVLLLLILVLWGWFILKEVKKNGVTKKAVVARTLILVVILLAVWFVTSPALFLTYILLT